MSCECVLLLCLSSSSQVRNFPPVGQVESQNLKPHHRIGEKRNTLRWDILGAAVMKRWRWRRRAAPESLHPGGNKPQQSGARSDGFNLNNGEKLQWEKTNITSQHRKLSSQISGWGLQEKFHASSGSTWGPCTSSWYDHSRDTRDCIGLRWIINCGSFIMDGVWTLTTSENIYSEAMLPFN